MALTNEEVKKFGYHRGEMAAMNVLVTETDRTRCFHEAEACPICLTRAAERLCYLYNICDDHTVTFLAMVRSSNAIKRRILYRAFRVGQKLGIKEGVEARLFGKRRAVVA